MQRRQRNSQKVCCTCRGVVLVIKPIAFSDVFVTVAVAVAVAVV